MSDTPILDTFLSDLANGLPQTFSHAPGRFFFKLAAPVQAYEISNGYTDDIVRAPYDSRDTRVLDGNGKFSAQAIIERECKRLSRIADLLRELTSGMAAVFAFRPRHHLLTGPLAEPQQTVAIFIPSFCNGAKCYDLTCAWIAPGSNQWMRQILPFIVRTDRLAYRVEGASGKVFGGLSHVDQEFWWSHDTTNALAGIAVLNRFLDKLEARGSRLEARGSRLEARVGAAPVYRTSEGRAHRIYNSK